jgi:hypothetical protein
MITLLVYFIVVVILFSVAIYVVRTFLPPEWQKFANVLLIVVAAFVVVYLLLGLVHGAPYLPLR